MISAIFGEIYFGLDTKLEGFKSRWRINISIHQGKQTQYEFGEAGNAVYYKGTGLCEDVCHI
jgi:hypothetical protein